MAEPVLTEWLNAREFPPLRVGVFNCSANKSAMVFRYYDGRHWYSPSATPHDAATNFIIGKVTLSPVSTLFWRGLVEAPKYAR